MGMESFFVKIAIGSDGSKSIKVFNNSLIESLNTEKYKTKKMNNRIILINDLVEMEIYENQNVYEISFVGCFSCFSVSCNVINDLINILYKFYNILSIKIYEKEVDISKKDFTEIFYEEYKEKYHWFKTNLTAKTFNSSPSTFYKKLKRIGH